MLDREQVPHDARPRSGRRASAPGAASTRSRAARGRRRRRTSSAGSAGWDRAAPPTPTGPTRCAPARRHGAGRPRSGTASRAPCRARRRSGPWPGGWAPTRRAAPLRRGRRTHDAGGAGRAPGRPSCPPTTPVRRPRAPCPPTAAGGSAVGASTPGVPTMRVMARFTMPETLPEGEEKVAAVRAMFDAIAPRYDLVNRIMTFRMDVRWRKRTVRSLGLRPGAVVVDLACGTGDLCRELAAQGASADRRRPLLRDAGRGAHRGPAPPGRRPPPARSRTAPPTPSRAASPCATSPACRRSSPSWPASCDRAVASRCSRWPSPRTGCCASATASTSGRSSRWSAGCSPTLPPTGTCRARWPTCPSRPTMLAAAGRRRLRGRGPPSAVGRHRPARHGDTPMSV